MSFIDENSLLTEKAEHGKKQPSRCLAKQSEEEEFSDELMSEIKISYLSRSSAVTIAQRIQ